MKENKFKGRKFPFVDKWIDNDDNVWCRYENWLDVKYLLKYFLNKFNLKEKRVLDNRKFIWRKFLVHQKSNRNGKQCHGETKKLFSFVTKLIIAQNPIRSRFSIKFRHLKIRADPFVSVVVVLFLEDFFSCYCWMATILLNSLAFLCNFFLLRNLNWK